MYHIYKKNYHENFSAQILIKHLYNIYIKFLINQHSVYQTKMQKISVINLFNFVLVSTTNF